MGPAPKRGGVEGGCSTGGGETRRHKKNSGRKAGLMKWETFFFPGTRRVPSRVVMRLSEVPVKGASKDQKQKRKGSGGGD